MTRKVVLVVDDEPHIVNLVKLTLADDYDVIGAFSGQEALKIIEQKVPDLVILDLMMPNMDGYQVCNKLRTQESTTHVPVMILSAKSQIVDKFKSINVGADDYMVKPFDPQELMNRVERNLKEIAH